MKDDSPPTRVAGLMRCWPNAFARTPPTCTWPQGCRRICASRVCWNRSPPSRLSSADTEGIAAVLAAGLDRRPLETTGSLDGAMTGTDGTRYRFNIFRRQGTLSISIRRLEDRFRTLAELGFSDSLYRLCDLPDGLIVVAGPTGAGKSTTLATLLDRINRTRPCHMVTIEDPIEYIHAPLKALVNQRQIGRDASSFYDALVASLRQDPDVILVGEIRDLNTIRTAIAAAETGHLVFTTVHAGDCVGTIERLVSVFPADEQDGIRRQLALVLRAIMTQHLVVADGYLHPQPGRRWSPTRWRWTGIVPRRRSRIVTSEVLMVTPAVGNLIATAKSNQIVSAMESGAAAGMQTLEQDLARLWVSGQISETYGRGHGPQSGRAPRSGRADAGQAHRGIAGTCRHART